MTLKEKIKFNEYVKPAKLPSPDDTDFKNVELTISGWGETHDEERPNELRMAKVRVASKKDVRFLGMGQEIGKKDRKTLLFVGRVEEDPEDVKGACRGDSGGTYYNSYSSHERSIKDNVLSTMYQLYGLHDDSANDNSAIDKMAARFWHTDDSATFLFEKKGQKFFPTPHGFHLKTFPTPYGC